MYETGIRSVGFFLSTCERLLLIKLAFCLFTLFMDQLQHLLRMFFLIYVLEIV